MASILLPLQAGGEDEADEEARARQRGVDRDVERHEGHERLESAEQETDADHVRHDQPDRILLEVRTHRAVEHLGGRLHHGETVDEGQPPELHEEVHVHIADESDDDQSDPRKDHGESSGFEVRFLHLGNDSSTKKHFCQDKNSFIALK